MIIASKAFAMKHLRTATAGGKQMEMAASVRHRLVHHHTRLAPDCVQQNPWGLDHHHGYELGLWIHPEQRASASAPGVVPDRAGQRVAAGIDANGEAQSEAGAHFGNRTKRTD